MEELENIEDVFCSDRNELEELKEGGYVANIVDAELDIIKASFCGGGTVNLDVSDYTYLELTRENILILKDLLEEAEIMIEIDNKQD